MTTNTNLSTSTGSASDSIIVGLFQDGDKANNALAELRQKGFAGNQIGAAFRSGYSRSASGAQSPAVEAGKYQAESNAYAGATSAGSLAGTQSTVPGGTGTPTADFDPATYPHRTEGSDYPVTGNTARRVHRDESWWDRVKSFFGDDDAERRTTDAAGTGTASANQAADRRNLATSSTSRGYGDRDYDFGYESTEFEGTLSQIGIAPDRARYLARELPEGGAIVTVRANGRTEEAQRILEDNDGTVRFEYDTSARLQPTTRAGSDVNTNTAGRDFESGNDRIQLFGEVLRVHTDRIDRGEVVVRKAVVTENQAVEVPVTREEFVIESVPVSGNQPAAGATFSGSEEIRIPLSEEQVRVEKQPVVREEVRVGKREVATTQTVEDQVRHEELRIDNQSDTGPENPNVRKTA